MLRRVQLIGACPRCGAETYSQSIADLCDLGKQLESFAPTTCHECRLKTCSETSDNLSIVDAEPPYSKSDYSLDLDVDFLSSFTLDD